jgi:dienelactone hydrolase
MMGVYDMRAPVVLLCILIFIGSAGSKAAGSAGKYDADGGHTVSIETLSVPSVSGSFATTAFIPSGRGPFPVVILSSGFLQRGDAYAPYARRLASWGIITLLRDDPSILSELGQKADLGESHPDRIDKSTLTGQINATGMTNWIALDLLHEFDWLTGTANTDPASPLYRKVDRDHIGLAGHSYGGQAALLAGEHLRKRIKGVFGLDPVDLPLGPQARDNLATIGVPVVFLGETTDSSFASCAPSWSNYQMLYRYAATGTVMITAVGADHTMFEDPANCSLCWLCSKGPADGAEILRYSVRYLTAFFARELLKDRRVGSKFEGAGAAEDVNAARIEISVK